MSKIVIGIACHKPSELPDNELYLPIHVGAALAKKPLPGAQPDNTGDNISEKNPSYCELTAQYWLWKNVDADYIGLCHYRRFMSFAPEQFTNLSGDFRRQVIVPTIDDYTKEKYYLNNERAMRQMIEQYDVVATEEQDLTHVYTPRGPQNTVYKHFAAHDHDLISTRDLDRMLGIVKERYPQYADDMVEYLDGPHFRGFNCFVMKKDLFDEMCSFEFDVLAELERTMDMEHYDTTLARVYGFMGEILYSSFLYHLRKHNLANIKDVQMLFFRDSEPKIPIVPREGAVPVVINMAGEPPILFEVTERSFVSHLDPDRLYDVVLVHSDTFTSYHKKRAKAFFADYPNVRIDFIDWNRTGEALIERSGIEGFHVVAPQVYLPWILPKFDRAIMLGWNLLFEDDWTELADFDLKGHVIGAAYNIEWIGEINGVFPDSRDYASNYLGIDDVYSVISTAVLVLDLKKLRETTTFAQVVEYLHSYDRVLDDFEAFNAIYAGKAEIIPQRFDVKVATYEGYEAIVNDAPVELAKEYKAAKANPVIVQYNHYDPWWMIGADHEVEFWKYARQSDLYEAFIEAMLNIHILAGKEGRQEESQARRILNRILPYGSKRREVAQAIAPRGSLLFNVARSAAEKVLPH